jgi:hypothetical protein
VETDGQGRLSARVSIFYFEKNVCKIVGAKEIPNIAHEICRFKLRKKWWGYLHRLGLAVYFAISAKTRSDFEKMAIFSKKNSTRQ